MDFRTNQDSVQASVFDWRQHSAWAIEAINYYLSLSNYEKPKKFLAELSRSPADLPNISLSMSAAFAFHCLELLAQKKSGIAPSIANTIVDRALEILIEFENRSKQNFSHKQVQDIFRSLEQIEKNGSTAFNLWPLILNERDGGIDFEIPDVLLASLHLKKENIKFQEVIELLRSNEAFLAWKNLNDITEQDKTVALAEWNYYHLLAFGLFSDPEMIKSEIRKARTTSFESYSYGLLCLYTALLARGDSDWIKSDKTLYRPFEKALKSRDNELASFLYQAVKFVEEKSHSRLRKQRRIQNMLKIVTTIVNPEEQLLCLCVVYSMLRKEHWSYPTQAIEQIYQQMSSNLSEGICDHLWEPR